ncbi:hypothetical protein AMTR_s00017p00243550 [Amborella trichopoda]|uniref:Integrase zinc-binding domain-containing protein n=1 Tax=Amborella trichopoda TaxID=13333 RepID=W1PLW6_AMBTC|nr:hypothetical protein AMTR_s00017p00243550 [Amborella trichopoda]
MPKADACVSRWGELRKELMRECHDTEGHPIQDRTLALLSNTFYWPQMEEDVKHYVQTCLFSLSMNFIDGLPKVDGMTEIIVVVDRFSKYKTFIAALDHCTTEVAAKIESWQQRNKELIRENSSLKKYRSWVIE